MDVSRNLQSSTSSQNSSDEPREHHGDRSAELHSRNHSSCMPLQPQPTSAAVEAAGRQQEEGVAATGHLRRSLHCQDST